VFTKSAFLNFRFGGGVAAPQPPRPPPPAWWVRQWYLKLLTCRQLLMRCIVRRPIHFVRSTKQNCSLCRRVLERKTISGGVRARWQGALFIRMVQQQTVDTTCPLFSRPSRCGPTYTQVHSLQYKVEHCRGSPNTVSNRVKTCIDILQDSGTASVR
jgi:hypothetical protein